MFKIGMFYSLAQGLLQGFCCLHHKVFKHMCEVIGDPGVQSARQLWLPSASSLALEPEEEAVALHQSRVAVYLDYGFKPKIMILL